MRYRSKAVVEAFQVHPDDELTRQLPPPWLVDALVAGQVKPAGKGGLVITNGTHAVPAEVGDWIVKKDGWLTVLNDASFKSRYERIE